jgi:hypothetical protein
VTFVCDGPRCEDGADEPLSSSSLGDGKRVSSLVLRSAARDPVFFATLRVARIALMSRCRRPRSEAEGVSPPSSSDQRRAILEHCSIAGVRRSIAGEPGHQDAESTNEAPNGNPARPGREA